MVGERDEHTLGGERTEVEKNDDAVLTMVRAVKAHSEEARAAGLRVWDRVQERIKGLNKAKADEHRRFLEQIEEARTIVVDGSRRPAKRFGALADHVRVLRAYECRHKNLPTVSARDAYVDQLVENQFKVERSRRKEKRRLNPRAKIEELPSRDEVRGGVIANWFTAYENGVAHPAFLVAQELRELALAPLDQRRTRNEWWEIGVSVLLVESPDTEPHLLGLEASLKWDGPGESGSTFASRRLMHSYMEFPPLLSSDGEHELLGRYWAFVRRAARQLWTGGLQIEHAKDFTWLMVEGERYQFSKGNQSETISVLFDAWTRAGGVDGCGLAESTIGELIGSASEKFRIQNTFAKHEALGTILRAPQKGVYALFLNRKAPGCEEPE